MRVCVRVCVRRVVLTTSTPRFLATAITVFRVPKSTPKDVYGVSVTRIEQGSNKKNKSISLMAYGEGRGESITYPLHSSWWMWEGESVCLDYVMYR